MPLSFTSVGGARFSAVTSIDWDNIANVPAILNNLAPEANNLGPETSDGGALGSATYQWSDLYLASGAVINYTGGGYTVTHSTGTLSFSGAVSVTGAAGFTGAATFSNYLDVGEIAAPSSPSANIARFYARDDGAGTTRMFYKNSAGTETPLGGRVVLSADTTYNIGAAQTYTTPQALYEYVRDFVDTAGFDVIGQLSDSSITTTSDIDGPLTGGGRFILRGDTTTPGNRILTTSTSEYTLEIVNGATVYLEGVKLTHTGAAGGACFVRHGAELVISDNPEFGGGTGSVVDIALQNDARLRIVGDYRISGTRTRHISGSSNSNLSTINAVTVTLVSTPVWTEAFAYSHASARLCFRSDMTFSGSATGKRFLVEKGGEIFANGAALDFLPGNADGTLDGTSSYDEVTGSIVVNNNSSAADAVTGSAFHAVGANSTVTSQVIDTFGANSAAVYRRANGTKASKSALSSGDTIYSLSVRGYGTNTYISAARGTLNFVAAENWSNTVNGTYATINVTPTGGSTLTEIVRYNGTNITASMPRYGADGSASAPAYAFTNQTNTGAYYTSNTWNVATQGTLRASISSAGLVLSTPLLPASGGIGVASPAAYIGASGTFDMNVTTDQAVTIALPSGYTRYRFLSLTFYEPSISLTTAVGGMYTSASKAGVQVIPAAQAYSSLTTTGPDAAASMLTLAMNTIFFSDTSLFFSLSTPQGAAATVKYAFWVQPLP
jgi:hypothetical protein